MAADIQLNERLILVDPAREAAAIAQEQPIEGRVLHTYGDRIRIVEQGEAPELQVATAQIVAEATAATRQPLSEIESLGAAAFQLRLSNQYTEAKRNRPL